MYVKNCNYTLSRAFNVYIVLLLIAHCKSIFKQIVKKNLIIIFIRFLYSLLSQKQFIKYNTVVKANKKQMENYFFKMKYSLKPEALTGSRKEQKALKKRKFGLLEVNEFQLSQCISAVFRQNVIRGLYGTEK